MHLSLLGYLAILGVQILAQKPHPLASPCGPRTANISCVYRYQAYMPPAFYKDADPTVGYTGTDVPDDASWELVQNADFVIFDKVRGLEILGPTPKIQHRYLEVLNVIHEAPIFVPELNRLFLSQDGPPGNMNRDPPSITAFETDPPVYQATGGILHDNMIYWALQGNNVSLPSGIKQRPEIARVNPKTLKAEILNNNYYGFYFGGLNDLHLATYCFRPSTGEVQVVESSLQHPNGIVFSRDGQTLYISDTGLETVGPKASRGKGDSYDYPIRIYFTSTLARNIYAFDVNYTPRGAYLTNKRNIFQSLEGSPDGMKMSADGNYLVVGSGLSNGVDIVDKYGAIVARIQTTHPVENVVFAGMDFKTLYLVGIGGITRVEWNMAGPDPNAYYI